MKNEEGLIQDGRNADVKTDVHGKSLLHNDQVALFAF